MALYLQRESSFPRDGMAEAIFRSFAKGVGKFPKTWAQVLLKKCNESFIERWQADIFNSIINQEKSTKSDISELPTKLNEKVPKESTPRTKERKTAHIILVEKVSEKIAQVNAETPKPETTTAPPDLIPETSEIIPDKIEPETKEVKSLPESIIRILTVSLSESLEKDGKLNPRKLVRALNTRSNGYNIKRKEREISFLGKRVTHKFTIPSDIELTAQ